MKDLQKIEVARSYSGKVNLGNYEVRDVFCSVKAECDFKDIEQVSNELYHFCVMQVRKDIADIVHKRDNADLIDAESDLMGVNFKKRPEEQIEDFKESKGAMGSKDKREDAYGEPPFWAKNK